MFSGALMMECYMAPSILQSSSFSRKGLPSTLNSLKIFCEQHNETRTSANNLHGIMIETGNAADAAELAARFNLLT